MANMSRGQQQSDIAAFLELARDPEAFAARLAELDDATKKANAAIEEAKNRAVEVGEKVNVLNARETGLVRRENALADDEAALAADRDNLKAGTDAATAALALRERTVSDRENVVTNREQTAASGEADLAAARVTMAADQAAAQKMRGDYEAKAAALRSIICPEG